MEYEKSHSNWILLPQSIRPRQKHYHHEEEPFEESENIANPPALNASNFLGDLTNSYIKEIHDILEIRQEVNHKNALHINKEMQNRLLMVRLQIQTMMSRIRKRYYQNEQRMMESLNSKKRKSSGLEVFGRINRGQNFFIKGNTYFRDSNERNCPNNADYFERRRNGEMFPMDFELTSRHIWSITDKTSIVAGIKEQIITELKLDPRSTKKTMKTSALLKIAGNAFKIDWNQISAHNLSYRHSPSSCKAMWDVYMHPSLKHDNFSTEENESLQMAVEKYNYQDWKAIAEQIGERSDYQCFLQFHTAAYFRKDSQRWEKKDDNLLLQAIENSKNNGVINWTQVAFAFPNKSKQSLQQRYQYAIHPEISHDPFTGEEDLLLIAAVQEYGTNFAKFPRTLFPNRSIIQLRSRYNNTLSNRHKSVAWSLDDDRLLLKFVEENGSSAWKKCAEALDNRHTRISCRQRYMVIQKHLKKDTKATLEQLPRRPHRLIHSTVTPQNFLEKVEQLRTNPDALVKKGKTKLPQKKRQRNEVENKIIENSKRRKIVKEKQDVEEEKSGELNEVEKKATTNEIRSEENIHLKTHPNNERRLVGVNRFQTKVNLQFHNFLKYSYNFQFGKKSVETPGENYIAEIRRMKHLLGLQVSEIESAKNYKRLPKFSLMDRNTNGLFSPKNRQQKLNKFLRKEIQNGKSAEPNGSYMEPNFSTISAFRALCILTADVERKPSKNFTANQSDNDDQLESKAGENFQMMSPTELNDVPAIKLFRQRVRCLFYKTAVLSRISPSMLENLKNCKSENEGILTNETVQEEENNSSNFNKVNIQYDQTLEANVNTQKEENPTLDDHLDTSNLISHIIEENFNHHLNSTQSETMERSYFAVLTEDNPGEKGEQCHLLNTNYEYIIESSDQNYVNQYPEKIQDLGNRLLNCLSGDTLDSNQEDLEFVKKEKNNQIPYNSSNMINEGNANPIEENPEAADFLTSPLLEETMTIVNRGLEFVKSESSPEEVETLRVILKCKKESHNE